MQMLQITPVMGYVAAHAQGMTIGPNILILPPLNPMHVAEEAATLDVLTGGNYILGIGLGYRQPEFRGPGQPSGPVLYGQRCRHRREAGAPGRSAALHRRAGRCVGQARGADRRRLADRQINRPTFMAGFSFRSENRAPRSTRVKLWLMRSNRLCGPDSSSHVGAPAEAFRRA
jgi:Luciferase-like monooxygenase